MADERLAEFQKLYQAALAHAQKGSEVESELAFARAAAFAPEHWCDVATQLAKSGEEGLAIEHFKTVLQVTAHAGIRSGIFNNIAVIYAKHGQLDDAAEMLDEALKLYPESADALTNYGQVWKWRGNLDLADRYCSRALAINPWHNEAQFLQALNALDRGDYAKGFKLYECRWRSKTNGFRKLECFQPEWSGPGAMFHGERLKRLFVYCEQGAGDIFLMLRYAKMIREAGMWQHWAVKPGMGELVAPLVDSFSEKGEPPDNFDCHVPSASFPLIFKTTLQNLNSSPYVVAPAACDYGPGVHVGIVWRGNTGQFNDRIRSTNLASWQPVLDVPGVTFHSLQVDGALEACEFPQIVMHSEPENWMETARRLAGLDLLISVDTGIVHLAGAMGVPTWCALHCRPYFVFPVACSGTPWYSSVRLFKQNATFVWSPVFERIADELRKLVPVQSHSMCLA